MGLLGVSSGFFTGVDPINMYMMMGNVKELEDKLALGVVGFEEGFFATFFAEARSVVVDDLVLVGGFDGVDGVLGPR